MGRLSLQDKKKTLLSEVYHQLAEGFGASIGLAFLKQLTDFINSLPMVDFVILSKLEQNSCFSIFYATVDSSVLTFNSYVRDKNLSNQNKSFAGSSLNHKLCIKFKANDALSIFLLSDSGELLGEILLFTKDNFSEKDFCENKLNIISKRASIEFQRFQTEEDLKSQQDSLESVIEQRTDELKQNNVQLAQEIERRKHIENNLRVAKVHAEQATKAKSLFLANMSHEIRTPMNGILGMIALLESQKLPPQLSGYIKTIKRSSDSLLHIINDILDISKLESGKTDLEIRRFNLKDTIDDVCKLYFNEAKSKGISVFYEYRDDTPETIESDQVRIRQVIENLVSNAIKFTDTGCIIIKVSIQNNNQLEIVVRDTGEGLSPAQQRTIFNRFTQADSSTTRKHGGTGLGLAICESIAKLLGGVILCQSKKNSGTTFSFKVPIEVKSVKKSNPFRLMDNINNHVFLINTKNTILTASIVKMLRSKNLDVYENIDILKSKFVDKTICLISNNDRVIQSIVEDIRVDKLHYFGTNLGLIKQFYREVKLVDPAYSIQHFIQSSIDFEYALKNEYEVPDISSIYTSQKILLVEDNQINRIVAKDLLESMGADVVIASDGAEALGLYKPGQFDIIFMDCLMPKMDGFEAMNKISEKDIHRPPVIALTANAMKGDREKCLEAGFDDYLSKPISIKELIRIKNKNLSY